MASRPFASRLSAAAPSNIPATLPVYPLFNTFTHFRGTTPHSQGENRDFFLTQQGLTGGFACDFSKKFPLKIKARNATLKVTCQELSKIKFPA
jgi:cytochrome c oxidase assembly protein Cox11